METNRCRTTGTFPQFCLRKICGKAARVFTDLKNGVCNRLEWSRNIGQRTSEPDFWKEGHQLEAEYSSAASSVYFAVSCFMDITSCCSFDITPGSFAQAKFSAAKFSDAR